MRGPLNREPLQIPVNHRQRVTRLRLGAETWSALRSFWVAGSKNSDEGVAFQNIYIYIYMCMYVYIYIYIYIYIYSQNTHILPWANWILQNKRETPRNLSRRCSQHKLSTKIGRSQKSSARRIPRLYYTILYYTILYYTTLYYTVVYYIAYDTILWTDISTVFERIVDSTWNSSERIAHVVHSAIWTTYAEGCGATSLGIRRESTACHLELLGLLVRNVCFCVLYNNNDNNNIIIICMH